MFVKSEIVKKVLNERNNVDPHIVLQLIAFLRKIVNHPRLIYDYVMKNAADGYEDDETTDEEIETLPKKEEAKDPNGPPAPIKKKSKEEIQAEKAAKRELKKKNSEKVKKIWHKHSKEIFPPDFESHDDASLSSKFIIIANMLEQLFVNLEEKIIIVSNYTETLSIFENLCRKRGYPYIKFDGKTNISIRQQMVDKFNAPNTEADRNFVFLLSAKAGGCGLNLIGCNKMILLDPDWNPSNDAQVMGRIWRVGQLKECFIYRMYASNSIEERILEIQRSKENLSDTVIDGKQAATHKKFTNEVI